MPAEVLAFANMNGGEAANRKRERPPVDEDDDEESKVNMRNLAQRRLNGIQAEIVVATISPAQSGGGTGNDVGQAQPPATSIPQAKEGISGASSTGTIGQTVRNTMSNTQSNTQGLPQQQLGMGAPNSRNQVITAETNGLTNPNLNLLAMSAQAQGPLAAGSPLAFAIGNQRSPNNSMTPLLHLAPNNQTQSTLGLSLPLLHFLSSRNQNPGLNPLLVQQRGSANMQSTAAVAAAAMAQQMSPAFLAANQQQQQQQQQQLPQNAATTSSGLLLSLLNQQQQVLGGHFATAIPGAVNNMQHNMAHSMENSAAAAASPGTRGITTSQAAPTSSASNGVSPQPLAAAAPSVTNNILGVTTSPNTVPTASDNESILLYTPADETKISPYQCLARQQLEFFVVGQGELEAGAQGRNRPIVLGQVGIRCKWCAQLPHRQKQRASTYFPAKLTGVYQTAQNITNSHLMQLCQCVPASIQRDLQLLQSKKSGTGGGRKYWTQSAISCGIDEVDSGGLRLTEDVKKALLGAEKEGDATAAAEEEGKPKAD